MRRYKSALWLILILVVALATALTMAESDVGYETISPAIAQERLQKDPTIALVDVRTPEEFQDSHIPGAVLLPLQVLAEQAENVLPDKDQTIFIYCRSGSRSIHAAGILVSLGYTAVYDLGGIIDWPYPVTEQ